MDSQSRRSAAGRFDAAHDVAALRLGPASAETYGWFLHRLGEESARAFRLALADFPRLDILAIDAAHHEAVGRTLDRLRGHKLTYVDASSLVLLAERRIREVWGTDHDLALGGARVVP